LKTTSAAAAKVAVFIPLGIIVGCLFKMTAASIKEKNLTGNSNTPSKTRTNPIFYIFKVHILLSE